VSLAEMQKAKADGKLKGQKGKRQGKKKDKSSEA
jgi:hypothetical protein